MHCAAEFWYHDRAAGSSPFSDIFPKVLNSALPPVDPTTIFRVQLAEKYRELGQTEEILAKASVTGIAEPETEQKRGALKRSIASLRAWWTKVRADPITTLGFDRSAITVGTGVSVGVDGIAEFSPFLAGRASGSKVEDKTFDGYWGFDLICPYGWYGLVRRDGKFASDKGLMAHGFVAGQTHPVLGTRRAGYTIPRRFSVTLMNDGFGFSIAPPTFIPLVSGLFYFYVQHPWLSPVTGLLFKAYDTVADPIKARIKPYSDPIVAKVKSSVKTGWNAVCRTVRSWNPWRKSDDPEDESEGQGVGEPVPKDEEEPQRSSKSSGGSGLRWPFQESVGPEPQAGASLVQPSLAFSSYFRSAG